MTFSRNVRPNWLCGSALCATLSRAVLFLLARGPIFWHFFLNFLPNQLKLTQACFGLGWLNIKCSHTYPAHLLARLLFSVFLFLSIFCLHFFWQLFKLKHVYMMLHGTVYSDFWSLSEGSASDYNWFVVLSCQYREWPHFKIQPWNIVRLRNPAWSTSGDKYILCSSWSSSFLRCAQNKKA